MVCMPEPRIVGPVMQLELRLTPALLLYEPLLTGQTGVLSESFWTKFRGKKFTGSHIMSA